MITVYLASIVLCRVFQAIFSKKVSLAVENVKTLFRYYSFQNLLSAVFGLAFILVSRSDANFDVPTFIISFLSGLTLFLSQISAIYSMKYGSISLSSMASNAGMIIPVLAGVIFFNDSITFLQIISLVVFFLSMWFLIKSTKKTSSEFNPKCIFFLALSLVANGGTMLCQQLFTKVVPNGNISAFSFLSFGTISAFTFIFSFFVPNQNEKKEPGKTNTFLVSALILSAAVFIINQIATFCTSLISPIILFSFLSGGSAIISSIVGAIIYKEKITLKMALSILFGIASLVLIKLFSA